MCQFYDDSVGININFNIVHSASTMTMAMAWRSTLAVVWHGVAARLVQLIAREHAYKHVVAQAVHLWCRTQYSERRSNILDKR